MQYLRGGELQNWDKLLTDPAYWEEYRDNLTPVDLILLMDIIN
jgi:hypothetical protein